MVIPSIFQVCSHSPPAALQPLPDQDGEQATHEHVVVARGVRQSHTTLLERLVRGHPVRNEHGMYNGVILNI